MMVSGGTSELFGQKRTGHQICMVVTPRGVFESARSRAAPATMSYESNARITRTEARATAG